MPFTVGLVSFFSDDSIMRVRVEPGLQAASNSVWWLLSSTIAALQGCKLTILTT
jgi:hypothetical protein